MASEDEETVYCICRLPYDGQRFMIECEICKDWFHGSCVGIQEHQASDIEIYHCPNCQPSHGPLTLKKRRNWHRHDYSETDDSLHKAIQTGTVLFVQELKKRIFPSADEIPLLRLDDGYELTMELLEEHGFNTPILVHKKEGLDLKVPSPGFSIQDVENHVGSMREIDVIDVARQDDYKMLMREWTDYYNSPNRLKIFNVISLEFTNTKLQDLVAPPEVVRQLSWVKRFWPEDEAAGGGGENGETHKRPEVQRYCLMGVKDSYTDFHIDFGGTSVWYHVLRGEKVFYLIRPTNANLQLYETWLSASNQSETFFGDQVDQCYKCTVKQGQTMFIPTGWIHAVLTPIDSLVFGGNFIHSLNIDLQIRCYEIEKRVKTPSKYLFPNYETLHWYALNYMSEQISTHQAMEETPPMRILEAGRSISAALREWTTKKEYIKRSSIPVNIQYGKLLKDVQQQVKPYLPIMSEFDPPRCTTQSSDEEDGEGEGDSALEINLSGSGSRGRGGGRKRKSKDKSKKGKKQKLQIKDDESIISTASEATTMTSPGSPRGLTQLKPRVPMPQNRQRRTSSTGGGGGGSGSDHKDISVYDFDEDDDKPAPRSCLTMSSPAGSLSSTGLSSPSLTSPPRSGPTGGFLGSPKNDQYEQARLKLKISGAAGVSRLIGSPRAPTSDSEDQLVVDELPKKGGLGAAGLKMKLPATAAQIARALSSPASSTTAGATSPGSDSDPSLEQRLTMPTIRGGLNGSIADILEASGYGTETDFTIDENIGRASPSMRDAIQGMLSMSRMGGGGAGGGAGGGQQLGRPGQTSPFIERAKPGLLRIQRDMAAAAAARRRNSTDPLGGMSPDGGQDRMHTAYRDNEYVYPTLDLSDTESDHVFKPRGRQKKDDTWNPKAKLTPNCPKPERPHREGVRKTSVESQLEDAAVKMANKPAPKRQYIRKKPKETPAAMPSALSSAIPSASVLLSPGGPSPSIMPSSSFDTGEEGELQLSSSAPAAMMKGAIGSASKMDKGSAAKKPKKGMATAKQRLSKILKMKF